MMGEIRLTNFDMFLKYAGALLSRLQQFKDLQPVFIAECFEDI